MKVVQTCDDGKPPSTKIASLQVGTVFGLKQSSEIYLRVYDGYVNLTNNNMLSITSGATFEVNMLYPHARVVLQ